MLRWDWLDTRAWELRVPSEKGGNAREFAVEGSLRKVIDQRIARRRLDCPYIFHHKGWALGEDSAGDLLRCSQGVRDSYLTKRLADKKPTNADRVAEFPSKSKGS